MESRTQVEQALRQWLRSHHGVIGRSEALRLSATQGVIRAKLARGEWAPIYPGVYRDTATPVTPYQHLRAACVAAAGRAVASHESAAWLWELLPQPPRRAEVTVAAAFQNGRRDGRVHVHQSADLDWGRVVTLHAIPVTDPLRTLVDLGASVPTDRLSAAVDAALACRLVTVDGLLAEMRRLGRKGRPGPGSLRRLLTERGFVGVPHPSVLEGRTVELFFRSGLPTPEMELRVGANGEYRLDFAFRVLKFAIEVDGYVWHFSPEHLQRDLARRNALQRDGWLIQVYTWRDIVREPGRVAREIASTYRRLAGP